MLSEIEKSKKILVMLGVMSAMLLAALDQTIIATAMPRIVSSIKNKSVDFLGSITLTIGLVTLLLGFVWGGNQYVWNSIQIIGLFLTSIVAFVTFGMIERKVKEPIIPLSLFKNSIFFFSMLIVFLAGMAMFGAKIKEILASSIGEVFFMGSLVMVIAFVASFFLKDRCRNSC